MNSITYVVHNALAKASMHLQDKTATYVIIFVSLKALLESIENS